jgi:sporulation protein YlmC with PRC-barrel domain
MTNRLMLGVAISALMLSGALAQSSTPPGSGGQMKPPAAAPANPSAQTPAEKMGKQPAAKAESSAKNKSDKAKTGDQTATNDQTASGKPQIVASQSPDQFLASNFKGTDVIGSDGKTIGNVADILFEKDGTIKAYVISFGGFLGMGAKEVAIAPNAFEVVPGKKGESKMLKLAMSQNDLKSAQKFTEYRPPRPAPATTGAGGAMGGRPLGAPHPSGGMGSSGR